MEVVSQFASVFDGKYMVVLVLAGGVLLFLQPNPTINNSNKVQYDVALGILSIWFWTY
jgi:hypothetical protein